MNSESPAIAAAPALKCAVTAHEPLPAARIAHSASGLTLSGCWTAFGIGALERELKAIELGGRVRVIDGSGVEALDTAGAWVVHDLLARMSGAGAKPELARWRPEFLQLIEVVASNPQSALASPPKSEPLARVGRATAAMLEEMYAMLSFIGTSAGAFGTAIAHPARIRWRPILHNIQTAGVAALPIVGLLSFLLGIVVAYQGADQLRRYGANIFIADLVGLSVLREFAPLITAIIAAGRSGSAYAAQIGTMTVTEEIDAMRTLGIAPLDVLVLPKLVALMIALPLLTVYADVCGVAGGMVMAQVKLGVSFNDFLDRFVDAVDVSTYSVGIGKAPVFAAIIAIVGCFQGFRTHGGADSVGRQTTRAVVHATFLVIVADALFSIVFSILEI